MECNLPDEKNEFHLAMDGSKCATALHDIAMRIRETEKYDKAPITSDEFYIILNDYNINLDYYN